MKSKTKIKKQIRKKTNQNLVEIIKKLNKGKNKEVAELLSRPRRKKIEVNLDKLNKEAKDSETLIVPGKVLGTGNIEKKIKIIALAFSKEAKNKLEKAKCEVLFLQDEIEKNKEIKGKIIK